VNCRYVKGCLKIIAVVMVCLFVIGFIVYQTGIKKFNYTCTVNNRHFEFYSKTDENFCWLDCFDEATLTIVDDSSKKRKTFKLIGSEQPDAYIEIHEKYNSGRSQKILVISRAENLDILILDYNSLEELSNVMDKGLLMNKSMNA
jgi:hypothetical protein